MASRVRQGVAQRNPQQLAIDAKPGGGVLPISAVVASREVLGVFKPGDHGSTFGGNPLACAVARVAMDMIVSEGLDARAKELGTYFRSKLHAVGAPAVEEIRGRGLLIGVQIKSNYPKARWFCEMFCEQGILCKDAHVDVIRFAPPLVIEQTDIDWAMERIGPVLLSAEPNG